MTTDELKKETEENSFRYTLDKPWVCEVERKQIMAHFEKGYLAGSEPREKRIAELEQENAELRKIAEFQQSSNMNTHLENKKLKEGLAVGSTWNKYLNSMNKSLEEERDKYREMTFDMKDQLTKAKELLKEFIFLLHNPRTALDTKTVMDEAEQFLSEVEK